MAMVGSAYSAHTIPSLEETTRKSLPHQDSVLLMLADVKTESRPSQMLHNCYRCTDPEAMAMCEPAEDR